MTEQQAGGHGARPRRPLPTSLRWAGCLPLLGFGAPRLSRGPALELPATGPVRTVRRRHPPGLAREGRADHRSRSQLAEPVGGHGASTGKSNRWAGATSRRGQQSPPEQVPFTPRAEGVLARSLPEAHELGFRYVGTEHVLLSLVREDEGGAARILSGLGVDRDPVRGEVLQLLSGYR